MKKFYLLFVAAALAACSAEPVETEGIDSLNSAVSGKEKIETAEDLDPMGFYNGSNKLQGTLALSHDCDFLHVSLIPGAGELLDDAQLGLFELGTLPKENGTASELQFTFDSEYSNGSGWDIPLSELPSNLKLNIFVHAWGTWAGEKILGEKNNAPSYTVFTFDFAELNCNEVCAKGKGYWTNHGPVNPGNQENAYPEGGVKIGGNYYELEELQEFLQVNGNTGEIFRMKQHLITAILNIYNGVDGSTIANTIEEANNIILTNGINYSKEEINAIKDVLENFSKMYACDDYED